MCDGVKKVVQAWIEQILLFDSKLEYLAFIETLNTKKQKYKICSTDQREDDKYEVHIKKQYNNNEFPDD